MSFAYGDGRDIEAAERFDGFVAIILRFDSAGKDPDFISLTEVVLKTPA